MINCRCERSHSDFSRFLNQANCSPGDFTPGILGPSLSTSQASPWRLSQPTCLVSLASAEDYKVRRLTRKNFPRLLVQDTPTVERGFCCLAFGSTVNAMLGLGIGRIQGNRKEAQTWSSPSFLADCRCLSLPFLLMGTIYHNQAAFHSHTHHLKKLFLYMCVFCVWSPLYCRVFLLPVSGTVGAEHWPTIPMWRRAA